MADGDPQDTGKGASKLTAIPGYPAASLAGPSESHDSGSGPIINLGMAFGRNPTAEEKIVDRLTPDQLGKLVDQGQTHLANQHSERMAGISSAKQMLWGVLIALVLICVAFLHYGRAELLKDIVILLVGAGGGFMGGRAFPVKPDDGSKGAKS
jgi:hypothetical protein